MKTNYFEFIDLPQTPRFIRDSVVEGLGLALRWSGTYKNIAPVFSEFCMRLENNTILDLCSGSGDAVAILLDAQKQRGETLSHFMISDLFPITKQMEKVAEQFPENIQVIPTPVDALNVSDQYPHAARTIISSIHHFPPTMVERILRDAVVKGKAIFVLEPMTGSCKSAGKLGLFYLLSTLANPFLTKDKHLLKALFTYLIPLIPLVTIWDSIVSFKRIYTKKELLILTSKIDANFQWKFKKISGDWNGIITVLIGEPRSKCGLSKS